MSDKNEEMPPIGGIPGQDIGLGLASMWLQTLKRQVDLANDAWTKMRQGDYRVEDAVRLVVESVEAPLEVWKDLFPQLVPGGTMPPAWVNFQWGKEPDQLSVRLNKRLEINEDLKDPELVRLGQPVIGPLPRVRAERTGATVAKVTLIRPEGELPPGQYLGFVESDRSTTPLIVVTLTVPEPAHRHDRREAPTKAPRKKARRKR